MLIQNASAINMKKKFGTGSRRSGVSVSVSP